MSEKCKKQITLSHSGFSMLNQKIERYLQALSDSLKGGNSFVFITWSDELSLNDFVKSGCYVINGTGVLSNYGFPGNALNVSTQFSAILMVTDSNPQGGECDEGVVGQFLLLADKISEKISIYTRANIYSANGKKWTSWTGNCNTKDIEDKLLHIENKLFPLELTLSIAPSDLQEYTGANKLFTIGWSAKVDGKSVVPSLISLTVGEIAVPVDTSDTSKEVSANNDANILLTIEAEGRSATISGKINFAYPAYTSVVADNFVVNEANVKGLTKMSLVDSKARSHTYVAPKLQKVVYAYAKSYGALTGIVDANNVNLIANYTRNEITINGIAYYVYITTERFSTNGSITYKYQ